MTRWTLEEACKQCRVWQDSGVVQPVSVNLSVRLFHGDNLLELIQNVLRKADLEPRLLELEITESMVLHDVNDIIRQLGSIRSLGSRSPWMISEPAIPRLGSWTRIPIDALKLDRQFTNDLDTPSKRAIVNAVVLMAEKLNLDVIAEGVENKEHIDF